MFIHSVSHAVPTTYFSQQDCLHAFERASCFHQLGPTSQKLLRHVLGRDNGIEQRHLCLQKIEDAFEATPETLHRRFEKNAPLLATQAASQALDKAKLLPSEMDALIISTCTGYLCPGLTSYVAENLKIPLDHVFLDLVGHGCGAAIPNMRQAQALIDSHQATRVLSVCVEVCSAAFYLD
ncbi:MAG: stilbene synthase, partial [Limisphaerales bacterium]